MAAALHVDGQASTLALRAQAAHAERCSQCRAFAADVAAFTAALRAAVAELPSRPTPVRCARAQRRRGRFAVLVLGILLMLGAHPDSSVDGAAPETQIAPGAPGPVKVL
jgi:anti-sigma factor RsiW